MIVEVTANAVCPRCGQETLVRREGEFEYCLRMLCAYARATMPARGVGNLYQTGNIPWGALRDRSGSSNNRGTERSKWSR